MLRRAAAVVFVLVISPAVLSAQETALTVSVPSADVHKGPSTVTPVIGHASRGTVLPVSQNLGSWVKVPWPAVPEGIGYEHVTAGRVGPPAAGTAFGVSPRPSSYASPGAAASAQMPAPVPMGGPIGPRGVGVIRAPSHVVGLGGLVGSPKSIGANARVWRNKHFGIQLGFTRDAMTSPVVPGRVTSVQFEPGVLYVPTDSISDYVWFRPYVGSVVSFRRQTLSLAAPVAVDAASDSGIGYRIFGGSELTFASLPRLGVSFEVGYRRFPTLFDGFVADRLSASIAGHWYVK